MGRTVGSSRPSAHDGRVAGRRQGYRAARWHKELDAVDTRQGRAGAVGVRVARGAKPRGDVRHELPGDVERRRPRHPGATQDERRDRPRRVEESPSCPRRSGEPQPWCEPVPRTGGWERVEQEQPGPGQRGARASNVDAVADDDPAHRDRAADPVLRVLAQARSHVRDRVDWPRGLDGAQGHDAAGHDQRRQ